MKLPKLAQLLRWRPTLPEPSTALELGSYAVISAGVGLAYTPGGVIVAGIFMWWTAQALDGGDHAPVGTE